MKHTDQQLTPGEGMIGNTVAGGILLISLQISRGKYKDICTERNQLHHYYAKFMHAETGTHVEVPFIGQSCTEHTPEAAL